MAMAPRILEDKHSHLVTPEIANYKEQFPHKVCMLKFFMLQFVFLCFMAVSSSNIIFE